jgi:hypothetical protein
MENRISRIEGLEACTGLQELYLYSNRISSITGLDHLTGLKVGRNCWAGVLYGATAIYCVPQLAQDMSLLRCCEAVE